MAVLRELVQHHVREEEAGMFPYAEKRLGKRRSRELAAQMMERANGNGHGNGTARADGNGNGNGTVQPTGQRSGRARRRATR
jgi:hypothetical protein